MAQYRIKNLDGTEPTAQEVYDAYMSGLVMIYSENPNAGSSSPAGQAVLAASMLYYGSATDVIGIQLAESSNSNNTYYAGQLPVG